MFASLVFSAMLYQAQQPIKIDYQSDMNELGRPFRKAGRAIGNTYDNLENKGQDAVGLGDEAVESYMCSDPGVFVIKQQTGIWNTPSWVLKGALHVPAAGFAYRYAYLGARGPEAFVQLQIGQSITPQYQQQPPQGPLQINQVMQLPQNIGLLHVVVIGASRGQQEIRCDMTAVKQP